MYDSYTYDAAALGAVGAFVTVIQIISLIVSIFAIVCMWKIFVKAGKPGWGAIIPFYNTYLLFDIAWGNGWLFLLCLVPIVNFVVMIILLVKLAQAFGKGIGFAVGLFFLSIIFLAILAFDSSTYQGPA